MIEESGVRAKGSRQWAAYAASGWAFAFAAMSFYWAAGGTAGIDTLGEGIKESALARDPELIALTWITGILKVVAGLLALALVRPWGRRISRWMLLTAGWGASALLVVYGAGSLVQHGLMASGAIGISESLGSAAAVRWHMLLWDPWWLLGGILFAAATRQYSYGRNA